MLNTFVSTVLEQRAQQKASNLANRYWFQHLSQGVSTHTDFIISEDFANWLRVFFSLKKNHIKNLLMKVTSLYYFQKYFI